MKPKKCPCGGRPITSWPLDGQMPEKRNYAIICDRWGCERKSGPFETKKAAIEDWNKRETNESARQAD